MIEETAIIIECDGEYAWIEAQRKTACGQCNVNKACGTSTLSKVLGNKSTRMRAINQAQAQKGETVLVGLHESALLTGSFVVYIIPIACMLLFAIFGKLIAQQWLFQSGEGLSIIFGIIGLFVAAIWIRFFSRRIKSDTHYQPVVLRKL
ncbi:MAG: SoxR reducing system RseC family protein [Gammaproteobacteria bacterium]|nr:SoxR reducing system RseC family protein [Gammaproteobacteria bacterium]